MPRSRGAEIPRKTLAEVRAELRNVWEAWAASLAQSEHWIAGAAVVATPPKEWRVGAAYVRESHKDSMQGFSPTAQLRQILEDAAKRGVWIAWEHVFIDNITGRHDQRPEFLDLMALARAGKIHEVSLMHSSRFARNAELAKRYKNELRRRGIEVRQLNLQIDVTTPEGKLMENIQEAFDQYQSDSTGHWVAIGLREKHESGQPLGLLPETYFRDAAGVIRPHPELSETVLEGARRYLTGRYGFGTLAEWSDAEGHRTPAGRRLSKEWWRNTLRNPINAGYLSYRRKKTGTEETRKASFDGFMSLELFQQVQQVRKRKTKNPGERPKYRTYVVSGSTCPCGDKITATSGHRLRCRSASQHAGCDQPSFKAEDGEEQVRKWMPRAFAFPPEWKVKLAALIRAKLSRGMDAAKAERLREAIKRLSNAYTWSGLAEEEYRAQLKDLQSQLARSEHRTDEARIMEATKLAQDLPVLWDAAPPEKRKELFWSMFQSVKIDRGVIVSVRPKPELAPLLALAVHNCGPDRIRTGDLVLDRDVC